MREYLVAEAAGDVKHEFLRRAVHAMAGGTPEHAALSAAVIGELRSLLRGKPCQVFTSDLRVRVEATDLTTYPDVSIVCGVLERSELDANAVTNPVALVEVLSDSSEAYDRGEKFAHYRRIPSLREYLVVSQRETRLELFRREDDGSWRLFVAGAGGFRRTACTWIRWRRAER